jgi:hypothetical protein
MDGYEKKGRNIEEIFSRAVRAGKRTYFFDVKATRSNEYYLTITESKKKFNRDGKFHYEKHKIFLYKEDFEKFLKGANETIGFIQEEQPYIPREREEQADRQEKPQNQPADASSEKPDSTDSAGKDGNVDKFSDVSFEDLGGNSGTDNETGKE